MSYEKFDEDGDIFLSKEGSAMICGGYLQGIVSRGSSFEDELIKITDVSQFYYWIIIHQLDENPYQLIDSELVRYILFSALDFIAWVIGTPKIADQFEVIKFFF